MTSRELSQPRPQPRRAPQVHVYLESRYRKLERGLPQTIFYCPDCKGHRRRRKGCERCEGYGKLTKDSVQELLARQILPAFGSRSGKFHGAGREDIDVRMLGRGRPFVFQVVGAKILDVDLDALRERIHEVYAGRVEIEPFVEVQRPRVAELKESKFDKTYRAEVVLESSVDESPVDESAADESAVDESPVDESAVDESAVDGAALPQLVGRRLDIVQRTPSRVAHRRADLERERQVEILAVEAIDERRLTIDIRCSHGTYVKEWVSGDEGRTRSSLADELGVACRCEALDVLEIVTD